MAIDLSAYMARSEAARVLGCSGEYVVALAKAGRLASVASPNGRIYPRADVERLAAERAQEGRRLGTMADALGRGLLGRPGA